ncbi:MAG: hypothetical protein WCR78_11410 [Arcobacteraceae bacterium]
MSEGISGAGLPQIERLFIKRVLVPSIRIVCTWNIALYMIKREVNIIEKLIKSFDEETLQKRVLIKRAFAIEDHSRDYSINMTLEHLRIAGTNIMSVIDALSNEKEFPEDITIQAVKPKDNRKDEADFFFHFMKTYEEYIKKHKKNYSKKTKKHPWFVNFNNFDWSCFMYMHTFIHRRQIQAIIKELK